EPGEAPDVFLPMHANLLLEEYPFAGGPAAMYLDQNFYWIEIMARLRPGVSIAQAQAALAGPFHRWVESTAKTERERVTCETRRRRRRTRLDAPAIFEAAVRADGAGRIHPRDRLRQRRQFIAGASYGAEARDGGAAEHGRGSVASDPATPRRERSARIAGRHFGIASGAMEHSFFWRCFWRRKMFA